MSEDKTERSHGPDDNISREADIVSGLKQMTKNLTDDGCMIRDFELSDDFSNQFPG